MAYDNGKQVNRYAAQKHHRDELKRRHTPIYYPSYDEYCAARRRKDAEADLWFQDNWPEGEFEKFAEERQRKRDNGMLDYYEKWWKAYSYFCGPGWKKNLKQFAKRKRRQYYREYCNAMRNYAYDDMDDEETPMIDRFDDPWNWD